MGRTIQDLMREKDNDARTARGKAADAAAGTQINVGDLGAAARANAAKKAAAVPVTLPKTTPSAKPKLKPKY